MVKSNFKSSTLFDYLENKDNYNLFGLPNDTRVDYIHINNNKIQRFTNEFWTSKQRQACSLHEISYRACFKPQLPQFFISRFTKEGDTVYDPFTGRGTTILEAALSNRNVVSNDVNPLSEIFCKSRMYIPDLFDLGRRLDSIPMYVNSKSDIDLSMFYHPKTLQEIVSIKNYLKHRKETNSKDELDNWIQMVATNRLTGHSKGFFSVYTLPPNQAVSSSRQIEINKSRNLTPEYRDTKKLILKKTKQLIRDITEDDKDILRKIASNSIFLNKDTRYTDKIESSSVQLTVTSPPFLDVVQYDKDNWLRAWFNDVDSNIITKQISMFRKLDDWCEFMESVFAELYRITRLNGIVAFEVGEVKGGKICLDESVVEIGRSVNFRCLGILVNEQIFTKTANIWGIANNSKGTNTNRIVVFQK
ncbi:MAG: site-specific DNA-methyltransferase [Leptospiraceae bacterium]|nr:site-specific DNA-methyltransferase [Leptospiraceae bacterium]